MLEMCVFAKQQTAVSRTTHELTTSWNRQVKGLKPFPHACPHAEGVTVRLPWQCVPKERNLSQIKGGDTWKVG